VERIFDFFEMIYLIWGKVLGINVMVLFPSCGGAVRCGAVR
jgi:hypothetical protein